MHINMDRPPVEILLLQTYERRNLLFSDDLFHDPAWLILLRLRASAAPLNATELKSGTGVPSGLLKRWVSLLIERGYVAAAKGSKESERYVLTSVASEKLDQVFAETPA